MKTKRVMEKAIHSQEDEVKKKKRITQLIGKEQRELAVQILNCFALVYFPGTEYDPILLASSDLLENEDVIGYVESIGLKSNNYKIQYWLKQKK